MTDKKEALNNQEEIMMTLAKSLSQKEFRNMLNQDTYFNDEDNGQNFEYKI